MTGIIDSRYPMYFASGPAFVQFHNDGYRPNVEPSVQLERAIGRDSQQAAEPAPGISLPRAAGA